MVQFLANVGRHRGAQFRPGPSQARSGLNPNTGRVAQRTFGLQLRVAIASLCLNTKKLVHQLFIEADVEVPIEDRSDHALMAPTPSAEHRFLVGGRRCPPWLGVPIRPPPELPSQSAPSQQ